MEANTPPNQRSGTRIARYTAILTLSGLICKLLLIGFVYLAANRLGDERYGFLEYLVELGLILAVLFDFGFEQVTTRDLAGRPDKASRMVWGFWVYRGYAGLALLAVYMLPVVGYNLYRGRPIHWEPLILGGLVAMVTYHVALAKAILRSQEKLTTEAWMNLLEKAVATVLGSVVVVLGFGVAPVLAAYLAGGAAALMLGMRTLRRLFPEMERRLDWPAIASWQRLGVPIGLSAACILLLHREDTVMVYWIQGKSETGIYRAPYRFFEGLFLIPQMLGVSAYPVLSSLFAQKKPVHGLASDLLRFLLLLALPLAVGGTLIAGEVIPGLLREYPPEQITLIFRVLVWSLPPIFLNFILGTLLNATHRQRYNFYAAACALIGNLVLNVPAIYLYGGTGAAVVTIVSQGLYCVMCLWWTRDLLVFDRPRIWTVVAAAISSAVMGFVLVWLDAVWWVDVPIGVLVYGIGILLLRGLSPSDVVRVRGLLKPNGTAPQE